MPAPEGAGYFNLYTMRYHYILLSLFLLLGHAYAQDLLNDHKAVLELLQKEKDKAVKSLNKDSKVSFNDLNKLLDLGEWNLVHTQLNTKNGLSKVDRALLLAKYHWLNNDFRSSEKAVKSLTNKEQQDYRVQRTFALLEIEAWELEQAEKNSLKLLKSHPEDVETKLILGRAYMLQKKYKEALALANDMIAKQPKDAAGYFLKADVFFWDQNPEEAEKVLVQGLALNPLNADARFYYGYAIWRRIDARQLNAMVDQWDLALAINPLHFQTHWHLGNGHTNLTFADYVDADEKAIRAALESADEDFTANRIEKALETVNKIKGDYPTSVLPQMHEASLLYGDFDAVDRFQRLEKAEQIFLDILNRKKHYGPAHNGLAAVIKSKRIPYLKSYPTIMQELKAPKISNMDDFLEIFPDVAYYPGDVAKGMAWNQLYTSVVYFPFLVKQHRLFVIPPLHVDLALAMKAPYFRFNSTFDNRQWMDIRGVGSGAAAIEYVERGAFEERNVLLHEYVHLFHGRVLTDEQNRRIKALYYQAMEKGLTLDYYSQNNESEYLAQTYPAYFEKVKVHPLDFKSMNTLSDLQHKDPDMYKFLDELISKERAYLAGNQQAMASNWSQVYLNLAEEAAKNEYQEAYKLLDTALQYDSKYLPAILAYAKFHIGEGKFEAAKNRIGQAKAIDPNYAPIYMLTGDLLIASQPEDQEAQAVAYTKGFDLEQDYMEKSKNAAILRAFYFERGKLEKAIQVAKSYVATGSQISTYLRDRLNDQRSFYQWQLALLGYEDAVDSLAYLSSQRPQHYPLRIQYVEALLANGKAEEALKNLNEVYRTLQASQVSRPEFELLLAEAFFQQGDEANTERYLEKLMVRDGDPARLDHAYNLRLVRLLAKAGKTTQAVQFYKKLPKDNSLLSQTADFTTQAWIAFYNKEEDKAIAYATQALDLYAYNVEAFQLLTQISKKQSKLENILTKYRGNMVIKLKL